MLEGNSGMLELEPTGEGEPYAYGMTSNEGLSDLYSTTDWS